MLSMGQLIPVWLYLTFLSYTYDCQVYVCDSDLSYILF